MITLATTSAPASAPASHWRFDDDGTRVGVSLFLLVDDESPTSRWHNMVMIYRISKFGNDFQTLGKKHRCSDIADTGIKNDSYWL